MRNPLARRRVESERSDQPALGFNEWIELVNSFSYQGVNYTLPGSSQETIGGNFSSLTRQAYKSNGVIFACMLVRSLVFSEATFQFRNRKTRDLFGNSELQILEKPWAGGTTGDLLTRGLMYADLAGNAFFARRPSGIMPLRPDWTDIVIGSHGGDDIGAWDVDSEVLGYIYTPGGKNSGKASVPFLVDEVAHFAPIPDPEAQFRGMSWLTPVIREVMADKAATEHKLAFYENGATVNLAIKLDTDDLTKYTGWVEKFREGHEGSLNAYKTLFLAAGADPMAIGANLQQADFKVVQGAGETRIAAASGTPPVLVGLSEGLASATYSNYGMARRRFADATIRPLWRNMAGSLAQIVNVPDDAELWYDESGIAFLREDQKDAAQILSLNAIATRQLTDAGFEPDAVIDAVTSGDLRRLRSQHTGLFSVQLQPPGDGTNPDAGGTAPTGVPPPKPKPSAPTSALALDEVKDVLALEPPGDLQETDSPE